MRNKAAYSDMHKTGYTSLCILLFYAKSFYQCQEKTTNEPLAVLCRQTAMIVQIILQISERSFYLIVRIWHTCTGLLLIGKQVGHSDPSRYSRTAMITRICGD